jgi:hypothetical protein
LAVGKIRKAALLVESVADVDKYLAALRGKLLDTLEDDAIVNIEF